MEEQVRLLDGSFANGLKAVTRLTRSSAFTTSLGDMISKPGNEDRAVRAMHREFFADPLVVSGSDAGTLPADHVVVSFSYKPTPSMNDLKREFRGGVSGIFDGRAWKRHASAIVPAKFGEQFVWLAAPPCEVLGDSEEIIAWGRDQRTHVAPIGYRPIMGHNELLDLHRTHPALYKRFWMAALGSFPFGGGGGRDVAVLNADGNKPWLDRCSFDVDWGDSGRFPFVPQVSA